MNFNLNLTQEQKLVMTQQMQLSIKILQMSGLELQEHIDREAQENPVLEISYNDSSNESEIKNRLDYKELVKYLQFDNYSHQYYYKNDEEEISPFNFVYEKKSLRQYLIEQLIDMSIEAKLKEVCEFIIDNLDSKGYLDLEIEEISKELKIKKELANKALSLVQSLDPPGIAARNLKECLKLQLQRKGCQDINLYAIIENHLENLGESRYGVIAKTLEIDLKKVQEYVDIIKTLNPKPSSGFYTGDEVKYITPDAYIRKIGDDYHIIMNEDLSPKLTINEKYKEIIQVDEDSEAASYVKDKINNALFLIKSIEHRKSTIYKVLAKILEMQKDYFDYGEKYLKPMTLKDISESINMHESTVSRAIKEKYINTNRGTIKIKDLFTTKLSHNSQEDVSTTIIKKEIKELIDKEDKSKPLSDQAICDYLNKKGMNISRRTVAKYREEMNIKSSSKRRRF
ncbi:RNA polymerase factor sigma-54 [Clostridium sp. SYSU_GA19001]|uniref:RNA polymerase factor sigma-54 n=1 Tax=Clostridium caldaquaticum TaxID=2940653 RepID=UPI0020774A35|nr:RNA polymerase factor sigma-54 [Clostridium caldaquaticum]MCM8711820.1 RNA polymerase factor sigma-54 [Clostridium caldaquaticum]